MLIFHEINTVLSRDRKPGDRVKNIANSNKIGETGITAAQ
jgi:hypothetical protein